MSVAIMKKTIAREEKHPRVTNVSMLRRPCLVKLVIELTKTFLPNIAIVNVLRPAINSMYSVRMSMLAGKSSTAVKKGKIGRTRVSIKKMQIIVTARISSRFVGVSREIFDFRNTSK